MNEPTSTSSRLVDAGRAVHLDLSHLVLRTAHLDETIDFYEALLGMKANARSEGGAAISHDGEHHRIALAAVPPADDVVANAPGLEHIAYKFRSIAELLGNHKRLRRIGIEPFMALHHGGTLSAYYLDPDGIQVELFIDTQVADLSVEMMQTSERFRRNPIGVPVDLDDLVRRYEAGEPMTSLLAQPELRDGQLEAVIAVVQQARAARGS